MMKAKTWLIMGFQSFCIILCCNIGALVLSFETNEPDCSTLITEMQELVRAGALSAARHVALSSLFEHPLCKDKVIQTYVRTADSMLANDKTEFLRRVAHSFDASHQRPPAKPDTHNCGQQSNSLDKFTSEEWDKCCSILPQTNDNQQSSSLSFDTISISQEDDACSHVCCEFSKDSPTYTRLPALFEPAIRLRINSDLVMELEQESFLRPYDPAGILWPGGYLLSLCVADPETCDIEDHIARTLSSAFGESAIVELGAGIAAPSIALSLYIQHYLGDSIQNFTSIATDSALHALPLIITNAKANNAHHVFAKLANFTDRTSLIELTLGFPAQKTGFDVVLGSSLQSLFRQTADPESQLWSTLETLMNPSNPNAIAIFVHTTVDPLQPPSNGSFRLLERISGERFGMRNRNVIDGSPSSDFEVTVFARAGEARLVTEL
jgi:hypothetical protein